MITAFLQLLAKIISIASILIIVYAVIICIFQFLKNEFGRVSGKYSQASLLRFRVNLGVYLLLALEFLIASDIIQTVLEPNWNELAILASMVVLRTLLSYFLSKEIKEIEKEEHLESENNEK
jgi:Predicted membrane protein